MFNMFSCLFSLNKFWRGHQRRWSKWWEQFESIANWRDRRMQRNWDVIINEASVGNQSLVFIQKQNYSNRRTLAPCCPGNPGGPGGPMEPADPGDPGWPSVPLSPWNTKIITDLSNNSQTTICWNGFTKQNQNISLVKRTVTLALFLFLSWFLVHLMSSSLTWLQIFQHISLFSLNLY